MFFGKIRRMRREDVYKIIDYIAFECVRLRDKYIEEKDLEVDYVCIFSQNENEFNELFKVAQEIGKLANETPTGPVFAFNDRPETVAGKPKLLKIRKPDVTRPQRGDMDFNTDYESFKKKYLNNKNFKLIVREDFEMIELKDDSFNVLVYFANTPLSKQLGII